MKTVAIIQARLGSTRLPMKSLLTLRGHALIDWVAVPREDRYILALAPHGEGRAEDAVRGLVHWLLARSVSKE